MKTGCAPSFIHTQSLLLAGLARILTATTALGPKWTWTLCHMKSQKIDAIRIGYAALVSSAIQNATTTRDTTAKRRSSHQMTADYRKPMKLGRVDVIPEKRFESRQHALCASGHSEKVADPLRMQKTFVLNGCNYGGRRIGSTCRDKRYENICYLSFFWNSKALIMNSSLQWRRGVTQCLVIDCTGN